MNIFTFFHIFLITLVFPNSAFSTPLPEILSSTSYYSHDPSMIHASSFQIAKHLFQKAKIYRIQPLIDNIPVEGADRIITSRGDKQRTLHIQAPLIHSGTFRISVEEAIAQALWNKQQSLTIQPYLSNYASFSHKVWLRHHDQIRPSYRIRLPSLDIKHLTDIWVDAETGKLLKRTPVAKELSLEAKVLESSSSLSSDNLSSGLHTVTLENIIDSTPFLNGYHFSPISCCLYVKCPQGGNDCKQEELECASPQEPQAFLHHQTFILPIEMLGLENLLQHTNELYIDAISCAYLPNVPIGQITSIAPVDGNNEMADSDPFASIQTYYAAENYFTYIKSLLGTNFCFKQEAQHCQERGEPPQGLRLWVNGHIPNLLLNSDYQEDSFINQLLDSKGTSSNPMRFHTLSRIDNAAYIPAVPYGSNYYPTTEDTLGNLLQPYDFVIYFQGNTRDNAYDNSVIMHELTHVLTHTLVPNLGIAFADKYGVNYTPGALDEAWSDYFSASISNNPQIGRYVAGEDDPSQSYIRDISLFASCPNNISGEVHLDSLVYSNTLWEIRSFIQNALGNKGVKVLDQVFLETIAQAEDAETGEHFAATLLKTLSSYPLLSPYYDAINSLLLKHGVSSCNRAYDLSQAKEYLFLDAPLSFGVDNYIPAPVQFAVKVPAGSSQIDLSYDLYLQDGSFSSESSSPYESDFNAPKMLIREGQPIEWNYENTTSVPTLDNHALSNASESQFYNDRWHLLYSIEPSCRERVFYASVVSSDKAYVLKNIANETTGTAIETGQACNLSSSCNANMANWKGAGVTELLLILLVALRVIRFQQP